MQAPPLNYHPMISLGFVCRLPYHPMIILVKEYLNNHSCFISLLSYVSAGSQLHPSTSSQPPVSRPRLWIHSILITLIDRVKTKVHQLKPQKLPLLQLWPLQLWILCVSLVTHKIHTVSKVNTVYIGEDIPYFVAHIVCYSCITPVLLLLYCWSLLWNYNNFLLLCLHNQWWSGIWRESW